MTTVSVTPPQDDVSLFEALTAWLSDEEAVYPYDAVYDEGETDKQSDTEGAVDMVSSQDTAIAVALTELGYDLKTTVKIQEVVPDMPADGVLEAGDEVLRVNGTKVEQRRRRGEGRGRGQDRRAADPPRRQAPAGRAHPQADLRRSAHRHLPGPAYDFPFDVNVLIDPQHRRAQRRADVLAGDLRHPDTRLADRRPRHRRHRRRSTPTATSARSAASQQKIVGARDAGAELFLVPAGQLRRGPRGAPTAT